MIRARVYRGELPGSRVSGWLYQLPGSDIFGPFETQPSAFRACCSSLRSRASSRAAFHERHPPLISPAARERSWLARLLCPGMSEAA
jgi:hypothetical protein